MRVWVRGACCCGVIAGGVEEGGVGVKAWGFGEGGGGEDL